MGTYCGTQSNSGGFKTFAFMLLVVAAIIMGISYAFSHGATSHGGDALAVRNCISKGGAFEIWFNPNTGREAWLCQIAKGKFGISIRRADGSPLTEFIKDKMKRLEQVHQYLENAGYKPGRFK